MLEQAGPFEYLKVEGIKGKEGGEGLVSLKTFEPIFEELPGWSESTFGLTTVEELPENAKAYIRFLEEQIEAPIDIISTGPDRVETITLRHPFGE